MYQADTVQRVEKTPAAYTSKQLTVYQKGHLFRFELLTSNRYNPLDTHKTVHLRNESGTYTWVEFSDATRTNDVNVVLFVSYEAEKQEQVRQPQPLYMPGYTSDRALEATKHLGLPVEKHRLRSVADQQVEELIITSALTIPLGAIFPAVRNLPGTPLQFLQQEAGWLTRFTATTLTPHPLPAQLFVVPATRRILTLAEVQKTLSEF